MSIPGWELCAVCHGREVEVTVGVLGVCAGCGTQLAARDGEALAASTVQRPLG